MMTPLPLAAGEIPFLREITLLVLAAAVIGYVCKRLKVVPIIGFLLAGVVVGPLVAGGEDREVIATLAEFGVILLLFTIGLEFSLEQLSRIRNLIFGAGGIQVVGTTAVVTLLLLPFTSWQASVFTGMLVALSSTAIVLKVLSDNGNTHSPAGQTSLGILIFQDLAVVAMVMFVPLLAPSTGDDAHTGAWAIVKPILIGGGIIVLVLVLARRVVPVLLEFVARTCNGEVFLLSVIAICVATAYLTSLAGVSAALGAFLGGLVVSESRFRHHAFGEIIPLQILFSALFFVSVGMLLNVMFVADNILLVLLIVACVAAIKFAVVTLAVWTVQRNKFVAIGSGLMLLQVGEFAFVLGRIGESNGLFPMGREDGFNLLIASTVLLMMATPWLTNVGVKLSGRTREESVEGESTEIATRGHVVIAGWGTAGKMLAGELQRAGVPVVVITESPGGSREAEAAGHSVVFGATSRAPAFEEAGASDAAAVVIADDNAEITERAVAVVRQIADRTGDVQTRVIARVMEPGEQEKLVAAGADVVIDAEQASVDAVLRDVLRAVPSQ